MKYVNITKHKLLDKIKANRQAHYDDYDKACEGWQKQVLNALEEALALAKDDVEYKTYFDLPKPDCHLDEYDAVIDQIEWNEEDLISLELQDFNRFIRDDWGWKSDFEAQTALYVGAVGPGKTRASRAWRGGR
jgi:hypothetical protein